MEEVILQILIIFLPVLHNHLSPTLQTLATDSIFNLHPIARAVDYRPLWKKTRLSYLRLALGGRGGSILQLHDVPTHGSPSRW
jgi:hypothetical protein